MASGDFRRIEVEDLICERLGTLIPSGEQAARVHVLDNRYQPIELEQVLDKIRNDPILARHRYKKEVFDCDDYVLHLKTQITLLADLQKETCPRAVGCIFTEHHALSFCITKDKELVIINTQADEVTSESRTTEFAKYLRRAEGKTDKMKPTVTLVLI